MIDNNILIIGWNLVDDMLKSCWWYAGILLMICWNLVYDMLKSCWWYVGILLVICWNLVDDMLESCWWYVEILLMICWNLVDDMLESCWWYVEILLMICWNLVDDMLKSCWWYVEILLIPFVNVFMMKRWQHLKMMGKHDDKSIQLVMQGLAMNDAPLQLRTDPGYRFRPESVIRRSLRTFPVTIDIGVCQCGLFIEDAGKILLSFF